MRVSPQTSAKKRAALSTSATRSSTLCSLIVMTLIMACTEEGPMLMHRQSRRAFLRAAAALGTLPLVPPARAQEKRKLPSRGEYLIRGAHVMTMDAATGDIAGGDVHVRNGEIVAVGKSLKAPRATLLDGRGMIVLPGLVETHWHMWNSLL